MAFDVGELSRKKVAGIPVAYAGAAMAAGGLWYALRAKPTPEPPADTPVDPASDNAGVDQPTFIASPVSGTLGVGSVTSAVTQDTNDQWVRRAVTFLVAAGVGVSDASNALNKYVDGAQLSYDEGKLRDRAVAQFGLPPESVPMSPTQPYKGPATRQGTPPITHKVSGKSDDTFNELTLLYYGLNNADAVRYLKSANVGVSEPFVFGQAIVIPKWHAPKFYKATRANHTLYDIARVNGQSAGEVQALNPGVKFPVKVGTRVRVA